MDVFSYVLLVSAACGLIMVCGSFLLLYRGVIRLESKKGTTSFKFGELVQIGTTVPALGLFAFGLAFILIALHFAREGNIEKIKSMIEDEQRQRHKFVLMGMIEGAGEQDPVAVTVCVEPSAVTQAGRPYTQSISTDEAWFRINILAPGYVIAGRTVVPAMPTNGGSSYSSKSMVAIKDGKADLGIIRLERDEKQKSDGEPLKGTIRSDAVVTPTADGGAFYK